MKALVLAAGDGGRLLPLTASTPKPLVKLRGRPIINHVLDALFAAGVDDATVVTGYLGDQLRVALEDMHPCGMRMRFVENGEYMLGNARSIWAARNALALGANEGGFVLAMGDHVIEPSLVKTLVAGAGARCLLAVERAARDDPRAEEATLALVHRERILDLGKGIERWNALDTGVFWCTQRVFDAITPESRDGEAGAVFAHLARTGELGAVDVTGRRWLDIDTADDLRAAEKLPGLRGRVA